jgi:transcriptional regulator with XRE-family HTH domain
MSVTPIRVQRDIKSLVAGEIRAWMGRRGENQTRLAEAMGLTQSQVSKRLRGQIAFDIEELELAARFLGCEVQELLGAPPGYDPSPHPGGEPGQLPAERKPVRHTGLEPVTRWFGASAA